VDVAFSHLRLLNTDRWAAMPGRAGDACADHYSPRFGDQKIP
jgi:hypothetical protein